MVIWFMLDELQLCLTNICDLNCSYCYLKNQPAKKMPDKVFKKTVSAAIKNKVSVIRLTGGDIFNHPSLFVYLEYLRERNIKIIANISIKKITKAKSLLPFVDYLLVSFHNNAQLSNNLSKLKQLSGKTNLMGSVVFGERWLSSIEELYQLRNRIGFHSFFFLRDVKQKSRQYYNALIVLCEKISELNKRNRQIVISNAFPLCFVSKQGLKVCSGKRFDNGNTRLYIDTDGSIKPAAYSGIILGNILKDDLQEAYSKNTAKNRKAAPLLCSQCTIKGFCGSGITANAKYQKDPLMKYIFHNKYLTKFQKLSKKILSAFNFNADIRKLYYLNSGFFMNYPSPSYWRKTSGRNIEPLKEITNQKISLYVHFPFCFGACKFCRVKKLNSASKKKYTVHLLEEMDNWKDTISNNYIENIYFGGGSPQLMGRKNAQLIFEKLFGYIKNQPGEVTFELFPAGFDYDLMHYLKKYVTRISIGIQCFSDSSLSVMNRCTDKKEMVSFIKSCKKAGFVNINFDIIYGLYANQPAGFENDFREILSFGPTQVTYQPLHYIKEVSPINDSTLDNEISLNKIGRNILNSKGYTQNSAEDFSLNKRFFYQDYMLGRGNILGLGGEAFSHINDTYFKKQGSYLYHALSSTDLLYRGLFLTSRFLKININDFNKKHNTDILSVFSDSIKYLLKKNYIIIKGNELKITPQGMNYVDMISNILSLNNLDYKLK
ncbi:radical SAM protein [Candidatus Woesearchaeota archaeon]|nr:radical SAM protein [Candidatus Woesearchaeota archaeon]